MLEDHGIIVDCAEDGLEAVKKFEENEPGYYDVIYMDIMMPNMNGWECDQKNPLHAKTRCRNDSNHSNECKRICRRYH